MSAPFGVICGTNACNKNGARGKVVNWLGSYAEIRPQFRLGEGFHAASLGGSLLAFGQEVLV
jgi:hypothetical protein